MLRTSHIFCLIMLIVSCSQNPERDKASKRLVLKFADSVSIGHNIPVYIDNAKYTYLAKENFLDKHVELFLPDTVGLANLNSFELKRLDLFGSIGLYIDHTESEKSYRSDDTVLVFSSLSYEDVSASDLDTADVIEIIKAFQEVGKKFNGDSTTGIK